MVGNGVATIVIARWENEFDAKQANRVLNEAPAEPERKGTRAEMPETPAQAIRDLEA